MVDYDKLINYFSSNILKLNSYMEISRHNYNIYIRELRNNRVDRNAENNIMDLCDILEIKYMNPIEFYITMSEICCKISEKEIIVDTLRGISIVNT